MKARDLTLLLLCPVVLSLYSTHAKADTTTNTNEPTVVNTKSNVSSSKMEGEQSSSSVTNRDVKNTDTSSPGISSDVNKNDGETENSKTVSPNDSANSSGETSSPSTEKNDSNETNSVVKNNAATEQKSNKKSGDSNVLKDDFQKHSSVDKSKTDVDSGKAKTTYLTSDQASNARAVGKYLVSKGWTSESVAGALGNLYAELNINSTNLNNSNDGETLTEGLISSYKSWCENNGYDYTTPEGQCAFLENQLIVDNQSKITDTYPIDGNQYTSSTKSPTELAKIFAKNYEGNNSGLEERESLADAVYKELMENPEEGFSLPSSGTYVFTQATDVHTKPSFSSSVVATYAKGDSVYYTSTVDAEGYTWLVYTGASGSVRYVAVEKLPDTGGDIPSSGTYTFTQDTDVHESASFSSKVVATYAKGESVVYTSTTIAEGYIWLVYTGASGATRYIAVKKTNATVGKAGWPFSKAYTGNYEEGQQFGETTYNRGGSPDPYFHDGFDFGSAIYGEGSTIKAVTSGKVIYAGAYGYGLGDVIVVQAGDGKEIMYQEFSQNTADIHVKVGQTVNVGDAIGKLTSSHLHVGVTPQDWQASLAYAFNPKGPWINPITYIKSNM
ncbi:phage tail tip lysozyme [Pediococcus stilesii]|nr:phage tail tip lysozyme [Pediococcus stilesii]